MMHVSVTVGIVITDLEYINMKNKCNSNHTLRECESVYK